MKSTFIIALLILVSIAFAEESFYEFRINRNFMQEVFQKNLKLIFEHMEKVELPPQLLPELNASLENISMEIHPVSPPSQDSKEKTMQIETELFLDEEENLMLLELSNLELGGFADLRTESHMFEKIFIRVPLDSVQIILMFSTQQTRDGNLIPEVSVADVNINFDNESILISAYGHVHLYEAHVFEEAVKKWI